MSEEIVFDAKGARDSVYREILPQVEALIAGSRDEIANFAVIEPGFAEDLARVLAQVRCRAADRWSWPWADPPGWARRAHAAGR